MKTVRKALLTEGAISDSRGQERGCWEGSCKLKKNKYKNKYKICPFSEVLHPTAPGGKIHTLNKRSGVQVTFNNENSGFQRM